MQTRAALSEVGSGSQGTYVGVKGRTGFPRVLPSSGTHMSIEREWA